MTLETKESLTGGPMKADDAPAIPVSLASKPDSGLNIKTPATVDNGPAHTGIVSLGRGFFNLLSLPPGMNPSLNQSMIFVLALIGMPGGSNLGRRPCAPTAAGSAITLVSIVAMIAAIARSFNLSNSTRFYHVGAAL